MPIVVNYPALEQASTTLNGASGFLNNRLDELKSQLNALVWAGEDAAAYAQHQANWNAAQINLNNLLRQISVEVETAKTNFRNNEMRQAAQWGG
jgi:WXG100 family type VII secretion target